MDFDFNDEQYLFRDTVRQFLLDHFPGPQPGAPRPSAETVTTIWSALAELGIFSLLVPEAYGGLGLGFVDLALILEEFGRSLILPRVVDTLIATDVIVRFGTQEQQARLLPDIAEGRSSVAIAICESTARYSLADVTTTLTHNERGSRLNGIKILVPDAMAADKLLIVFNSGGTQAGNACGLVIVDRDRGGITFREHQTLDPTCAHFEVGLRNVAVSGGEVLGSGADAAAVARLFDASALAAATLMTGISGKVLDTTVDYVKQRTQFGKVIGSFQAIKHRCADMMVAVDSSRSAAYYAAWALANEAAGQSAGVSIAKSFCGDSARFVCNEGIQLHGGMGFTWDLGLHFYLRRVKTLEYAFGDSTFHRARLLSRSLRELQCS